MSNSVYSKSSEFFQICPCCRHGFYLTSHDMFDHITNCKNEDVGFITTKYYTYDELYNPKKNEVEEKIINPFFSRPATR